MNSVASTSSSSVQKSFKYDVFISFRGEDTRKTFVDHLYLALVNKGIITYKDDEKIEKGERISDQLIRSIEESRFYIIVFSKNYANSSWCLDELAKIMECQRSMQQTAYPVFYDVEPTEVRNQTGAAGEAFAKHAEKEAAGTWKDALKEAADLAGWELKATFDGHEAKFVQKIVQHISLEPHFINSSIDGKLVGMDIRVKNIVLSLEIGSDDVRMIGIRGMGGAGKTTLARAVYDHISIWFEGKCFVENVRERSKGYGLKKLQKQVLSTVTNDQSIVVNGISDGINMMKRMMVCRKVLLVLDDVDNMEQLEALAGELTWFKPGSRIIITTRDEQILKAHEVHSIHYASLLLWSEAICLFNRFAFKSEIPTQGFEELSKKVLGYAAGLPLTIKVLGSFLKGRRESEWKDAIERLKTIPWQNTLDQLEISYNGLESEYKEIFLDVACILKGEMKDVALKILKSRGFHGEIGLGVLEQKSLINISSYGCLDMHDHIEEMGMNIVRRSHPEEPNRHSRLWIKEEVENILANDLGTEVTRSIKIKYPALHLFSVMKGFRKMEGLRLLYIFGRYEHSIDEVDQYLPNTLLSLHWSYYPYCCLSNTFQGNDLVYLSLTSSKICQLWEGGERKVLNKLKFLNLCGSELRTFDLGLTPNLETLNLHSCRNFEELNNFYECQKLKFLDLSHSKVSNLNIGMHLHLEKLQLEGCNNVVKLHMQCPKLESLIIGSSKLSNLNIGLCKNIESLDLRKCSEFVELQMPHESIKLKYLSIYGSKLRNLKLRGCSEFVELHMPVKWPNLSYLNLNGSKVSKLNLRLTPKLRTLDLGGCNELVELHMPSECPCLEFLDLRGSKLTNLKLGLTPNLKRLDLGECNELVELHMPFKCPSLKYFSLCGSKVSNLSLGLTSHLKELYLEENYYLKEIHAPIGCLKELVQLEFSGCSKSGSIINTEEGCLATLRLSAESLNACPLHPNTSFPNFGLDCVYSEPRPSLSGNAERLLSLGLCACTNLDHFSATICGCQRLGKLILKGNIPEVPKDLYRLESLEELSLSMKVIKHLPDNICMLKHLAYLELNDCRLLELLPKDIGRLEALEELHLTNCISLRDIPNSVCQLKSLEYLDLHNCILLKKLPEEFGRLESLKKVDLEGTGITNLPQSIFQLKGLCIVGSMWRLKSYGFTSLRNIQYDAAFCHIGDSQHESQGANLQTNIETGNHVDAHV